MKARDWTHLFRYYRGKWVALNDDETTVAGLSGSSLRHDFRLRWIITGLGITAEYLLATTGPADETVRRVKRGGEILQSSAIVPAC